MAMRSFIGDILEQPQSLRDAIANYPVAQVEKIQESISSGRVQRIIMAGQGSSYNSLYPSFLQLSNLDLPVALWQTAEILKYGFRQIDAHTLVVLNSQSGRSVEVERLTQKLGTGQCAGMIAFTNYADSPLGLAADICIPLMAGEEHGIATKTFFNSLALASIFAAQLNGADMQRAKATFNTFADKMAAYLTDWQAKVHSIRNLIGSCSHVIVVGRGYSFASALNGAINQKEGAWNFSEGMNAAEFRHGPLELADEKLTLFIMEGDAQNRENNYTLANEVRAYGSTVIWIGNSPKDGIPAIAIPDANPETQPAGEAAAMQLVALALSVNKGLEAGRFRRIGKVVRIE